MGGFTWSGHFTWEALTEKVRLAFLLRNWAGYGAPGGGLHLERALHLGSTPGKGKAGLLTPILGDTKPQLGGFTWEALPEKVRLAFLL